MSTTPTITPVISGRRVVASPRQRFEAVANLRDDARNSCCGSPYCFLYAVRFSSCIAKDLRRYGSGRIVGSCADPRGEQRLRPLEVVRYSDIDEEPRANQPINPAVEKAGKNVTLQ